jgi:hypothetical protein
MDKVNCLTCNKQIKRKRAVSKYHQKKSVYKLCHDCLMKEKILECKYCNQPSKYGECLLHYEFKQRLVKLKTKID